MKAHINHYSIIVETGTLYLGDPISENKFIEGIANVAVKFAKTAETPQKENKALMPLSIAKKAVERTEDDIKDIQKGKYIKC